MDKNDGKEIDVSNIITFIFNYIKSLSNDEEKKNNLKEGYLVISTILAIISVVFYSFSYVFLYGYYFGGHNKEQMSFINIIVNPVPFNFKSLVIVGVILFIICVVILFSLYNLYQSLKCRNLLGYILHLSIFIIFIIIIHYILYKVFVGSVNFDDIYKTWFLAIISLIITVLLNLRKIKEVIYGFLTVSILNAFIGILGLYIPLLKYKISINQTFFLLVLLASLLTLGKIVFLKKYVKYLMLFLVLLILTGGLLSLITNNTYISISASTISSILLMGLINYFIKRSVFIKVDNKMLISLYRRIAKVLSTLTSEIFILYNTYIKLITFIALSIYIFMVYGWIFTLGQSTQNNYNDVNNDEINYYTGDSNNPINKVIGNIISQKDDVYYISTKERKLVRIKSDVIYSRQNNYNED